MISRLIATRIIGSATAVLAGQTFVSRPKLYADALESQEPPRPPVDERSTFLDAAKTFCNFVDQSPSTFHVVENVKSRLQSQGFVRLKESESWNGQIKLGGKYYVIRDGMSGASLVAFAVGKLFKPGDPFAMVATHVDSPTLKLKPLSHDARGVYVKARVLTYGGGLWHTWFDRDLALAGRVLVRTRPDLIETKLVNTLKPVLRISSLAVHYDKQNPFKFNTEMDLLPISDTNVYAFPFQNAACMELKKGASSNLSPVVPSLHKSIKPAASRHGNIANLVAHTLGIHPKDIVDFDLSLFDVQKAAIGGLHNDFVFASRIDNLMMTHTALEGFTRSINDESLESESSIRLLAMFDNEEISSGTQVGGWSTFLPNILRRVQLESASDVPSSTVDQALARSFLISADMTHAAHPTMTGWNETNHAVYPNAGLCISSDSGKKFVKNTVGSIMLFELARHYPGQPFNFQFFAPANNIT